MENDAVDLALSADQRLERFARSEAQDLYSLFRRCLGDADAAGDLLQETLLFAWKNLALYDRDRPFRAWIFRIGQNRLRTFLRRKKVEKKFEDAARRQVAEGAMHDDVVAGAEDRKKLEDAVSALPDAQRISVLLRYRQGLSCREIGEVLEMTENAVSIQLYHARKNLRARLEADDARRSS